ncbi:hypothetical protein F2Q70_00038709 [Brassica cretica]|uniref:Uncharacterized protein n=1 Tax=Brassica cretica TaxID=69181 RepID=A0A8S9K537_BRACR|nr:hypothetical protein F2Q70_00038709 [Brassica cretica]
MGNHGKEKNVENPDVVSKAGHILTANLDTGRLCGWSGSFQRWGGGTERLGMTQRARVTKSHELPKVVSCQRVQVTKRFCPILMGQSMNCKVKKMHGSFNRTMSRKDMIDTFRLSVIILIEELRMVLVKPRSREGSVSERLCSVWLDDAREEMVIVYEIVHKLCIGSHVSK